MKKQVYIAHFKNRLKGPTKVFAWDELDAVKAAYSAYLYHACMHSPNAKIEDVVDRVELDPEQRMEGPGIQPAVQVRCRAVESGVGLPERLNSAPPEDAWRRDS